MITGWLLTHYWHISLAGWAILLVYIIPSLTRAQLAALMFVRDPEIRVTPLDPWSAFDLIYQRKQRIPELFRIACSVLFTGLTLALLPACYCQPLTASHHDKFLILVFLFPFINFVPLASANWAPRCRRTWSLTIKTWIYAYLYAIFFFMITAVLINLLWDLPALHAWLANVQDQYDQFLIRYSSLIILLFILSIFWTNLHERVIRRDQKWFRLEEQ